MIKFFLFFLMMSFSAFAEDDFFKNYKNFFDEKTDFFAENIAPKKVQKDSQVSSDKFADIEDDDSFFDSKDNFFGTSEDFFVNNDNFFDSSDFILSEDKDFFASSDSFFNGENLFEEKKDNLKEKTPVASPTPQVVKISAKEKKKFVNQIVAPKDRPAKLGFIKNNPLDKMHITSYYGMRMHPVLKKPIYHRGIDLRGNRVNIYAVGEGVVSFAGYKKNYGNIVQITHAGGYETRYAHMYRIDVKVGQRVSAKQVLGLVGQTGQVSGPHLHFEIIQNGKTLNPQIYLPF